MRIIPRYRATHRFCRIAAAALLTAQMASPCFAFLDSLKKNLEGLNNPLKGVETQRGGQTKPKPGSVDAICTMVFGPPYTGVFPPGVSPEQLLGKHFNVTADMATKLREGVSIIRRGAMPGMERLLGDISDQKVRSLGQAYVRSPSVINLAHIVNLAENGDRYKPETGPSELAEAKTLLGLAIMQYAHLARSPRDAVALFEEAASQESGLASALLARLYLFGELGLKRDISIFSNYVAEASKNYRVVINDHSIFLALDKIPNWPNANMYRSLLQQKADMKASFNRSKTASENAPQIRKQALVLMDRGREIDEMTLDALGSGSEIALFRARGERMRKEASGEMNMIKIAVTTSSEYSAEFDRLLRLGPKLSQDAQQKFAAANKLRLENVSKTYALAGQVSLLMLNGNIDEIGELGGYIGEYVRRSCETTFRTILFAQEAGVPPPTTQISRDGEL